MKILITGAGGFVGQILAGELLKHPNITLVLTDVVDFLVPNGESLFTENATVIKMDLIAQQSVITPDLDAIYLLHGIMSSGSEENFDQGLKANFDSTRCLLETIRHVCPGVRVIYSSSLAVYGNPLPEVITENAFPTPQSSYGAQKLMCETLINDMNRKGFVNGFILRLPAITVRPGKPTAAASSFISGIIREPLDNTDCVLPIKDRSFSAWVCSPKTLCANLIHALSMPSSSLPSHRRAVNLPGLVVTVQDMIDALVKLGGKDKLQYIKEHNDVELSEMLYSWPYKFNVSLAESLAYQRDNSFEQVVLDYMKYQGKVPR